MRRWLARHGVAVALAALVAALVAAGAYAGGALARWENDTVDLRFQLRDASPPAEVAVVAIDAASFSELGVQWPFPRSLHARAIDRLREAGARTVVYDVQFTEATVPEEDLALYDAVARMPGTILATSEIDARGRTNVLGGDANLAAVGARAAAANMPTGAGEVIRRYLPQVAGVPTLAVAAARAAGSAPAASSFGDEGAWIDFRGPPGTVPTISFADLLSGRFDRSLVRGRVVVVGASAPTLQDVHATPTAGHTPMAGPEVQANAIWTAIRGNPLQSAPAWLDLLAIVAMAGVVPLAGLTTRTLRAVAAALPLALAYALGAKLAFDAGLVVAVTYPLAALALGTAGTVVAGLVSERRQRRRAARMNAILEAEVRARTEQVRRTQLELIRRLVQATESRDQDTGDHIDRIGHLCHALALAIGWGHDDADALLHASAMHDIGKIGIPDAVLLKPGRFTPQERALMETHTLIGAEVLADSESPLVQMAERIARTHHEKWDGSGYPAGLAGEEIPLEGRICAIVDVFDALLSSRPYKAGWSLEDTLAEIAAQRGRHFDPALVDAFLPIAAHLHRELGYAEDAAAAAAAARPAGEQPPAPPMPPAPPPPHGLDDELAAVLAAAVADRPMRATILG
ncbi:CHASE2 domain-containing protein [Miltoncostaea marina]|uniref:CHASE2 domain-containing protein n=1 Tax=Miltoncostaea marina TaxID=2843215 RepID=UPI001C3C2160|nr:CHASE2 domain-containing protein [Miltoncostaea marina]